MDDCAQVRDCLASRFALPSWWVRAYECAVTQSITHADAVRQSWQSGLVPALGVHELNGLADILASFQEQILNKAETNCVIIDPRKHAKHVSTTSRSRVLSFERMAQDFAGLRLLPFAQAGVKASPTLSFFDSETWEQIPGGDSYKQLLGLAPHSGELLLGMYEPYVDLWRRHQGGATLRHLVGDKPPLILWRSTWLDLQGVSQALLLRLEKAMQWDFRWLQLEGIFGQAIDEVFKDLEFTKSSSKKQIEQSVLLERLKILDKLGRKLSDHGLLTFQVSDQYLALASSQDKECSLVWQATQSRLHESERSVFFQAASRYLLNRVFANRMEQVKRLLGYQFSRQVAVELDEFTKQWSHLAESPERPLEQIVVGEGSSHPLFLGPLFLEWNARKHQSHPLPLPAELRDCDLVKNLSASIPIMERFENFARGLMHQSGILRHLNAVPLVSIASDVSQNHPDLERYLQQLNDVSLRDNSPESIGEAVPKIGVKQQQVPSVQEKSVFQNRLPNQARLKKIAAEELMGMQKGSGRRYLELRDAYIKSLDPDRQKLINEVRMQLQPSIFDEQIKQGLLVYMIENPHLWRSTRTSSSQTTFLGL